MNIPANLTKQQVGECVPFYGWVNNKKYKGHDAETVEYVTFIGALNTATGLYEGEHVFREVGLSPGAPSFDFKELPK